MLCTVRNIWLAGARFVFNFYKHWAKLLLFQTGEPPVTILSQERVTQGDPLSMILYRIIFVPLSEELRASDLGLLSPFYADDADFDGLARQSTHILKLLMESGADQGYFP